MRLERSAFGKIATNAGAIEFAAADLNSDAGWANAIAGGDYVLHVASPVPVVDPKTDDELVRPARDGTLRVGMAQSRRQGARTRHHQPEPSSRPRSRVGFSASLEAVRKLLDGSIPALPHFGFNVVDVRDIASLQLLAMTTPSATGQRFIGSCEFYWMADIANRPPRHALLELIR